jgi:uncharacterized membrane protein
MGTSLLLMLFIVVGMATGNPWLQYGGIVIVIAMQFLWMIISSARSGPMIQQNMQDAKKAMKSRVILRVQKREVERAKAGAKGGMAGMGGKTMMLMVVNLGVFIGVGYLLSVLLPGIPQWQSFAIAFLASMPVSTIMTVRMGLSSTGPAATPDHYYVCENGIVFDRMGSLFMVRYPIESLKISDDRRMIEVEGASAKTAVIPTRVNLYTENVNRLNGILSKFVVKAPAR